MHLTKSASTAAGRSGVPNVSAAVWTLQLRRASTSGVATSDAFCHSRWEDGCDLAALHAPSVAVSRRSGHTGAFVTAALIGQRCAGRKIATSPGVFRDGPSRPRKMLRAPDPRSPVIVSPGTLDPAHAVIAWNPVTTPAGIDVVGYEVIIEHDDFHVFDVKVPGTTTSVTVPPEFLQPATEYGFEVLAVDRGGNQTITATSFVTQ